MGDIPITNQVKAALDFAFLITCGLVYLGGGSLIDRLGTQRGFLGFGRPLRNIFRASAGQNNLIAVSRV